MNRQRQNSQRRKQVSALIVEARKFRGMLLTFSRVNRSYAIEDVQDALATLLTELHSYSRSLSLKTCKNDIKKKVTGKEPGEPLTAEEVIALRKAYRIPQTKQKLPEELDSSTEWDGQYETAPKGQISIFLFNKPFKEIKQDSQLLKLYNRVTARLQRGTITLDSAKELIQKELGGNGN